MTSAFEYKVLSESDEAQQLGRIIAQCFVGSPGSSEIYLNRIGLENFRFIARSGQIAGGLALIPMSQWWGGQAVPMTGIAAVGVAPEYRGTGAAIALLQPMLQELYDAGVPISVLYPATQRLYRKVGYEQAGTYQGWSIAPSTIQLMDRSLPIQAVSDIQPTGFQDLQQQHAKRHNGHLDRHPAIWKEFLGTKEDEPIHAYFIGSASSPEGYVIFSQHRTERETILRIRDWAILSAEAGRNLWTFLADHRSQIEQVHWRGAVIDPLMLLLPEQTPKLGSMMRWFLRVVNVRSALEKRGYPSGLDTELHLQIQDDGLPENSGKFILSVSSGRGKVTQGGQGELKIDIRGLAPLYTSLFTPQQLQLAGYLEAPETALATAAQLFAGASPWLPDFF